MSGSGGRRLDPARNDDVYDYIIVGAGTAGCVLANRLSTDHNVRVLLLEAGGESRHPYSAMPMGFTRALAHPGLSDWLYTEPDPGTNGRRHRLLRGATVGGSSAVNGMIHVRGHCADFDAWAQAGAAGWDYECVLPYFQRAEAGWSIRGNDPEPGRLGITATRNDHPVSRAVVAAFVQAGYRRCRDFLGAEPEGVGFYHATIRHQRRWSVARAYLDPVRHRGNLDIRTHTRALRLLFDAARATGVLYRDQGTQRRASARRELIVAAGAYATPQLLMLSGIGPAAHLQSLGIDVRVERATVGANLQDHLMVPLSWRLRPKVPSINDHLRGPALVAAAARYLLHLPGALSMPAADVGAFLRSTAQQPRPDLQFHALPASSRADRDPDSAVRIGDPFPGLTLAPALLRPESRGALRLASPDPDTPPRVHPGYFTAAQDLARLVCGVSIAMHVAAQPALVALIEAPIDAEPTGAPATDIERRVRELARPLHHAAGTCRMGADDDAVVDARLRVRGVPGLRIVDASVIPTLPSANTHATVVMIAERAADLLRQADAA